MRDNITKYSNPKQAQKQAYKYLGKKNGKLYRSTRKEKKYMVKDPKTNNWVHFGQMKYEDYTKHGDKKRRDNFRKRNHRWANAPRYSPAWLSYYLLW